MTNPRNIDLQFDCHAFLSGLVSRTFHEGTAPDSDQPAVETVLQQLAESYEVVNVGRLDNRASLIDSGVSPRFLEVVARGIGSHSAVFKQWAGEKLGRQLVAGEISSRVVDALVTLETEKKYALSPLTGTFECTRDSLGPNWYLFADPAAGFIAGQMMEPAFETVETVWIVPGPRKILFIEAGLDSHAVLRCCAYLLVHLAAKFRALVAYLQSPDRNVVVYDWPCEHFGHYVWNVISAWGAFFELAPPASVKAIACTTPDKFFGKITDVFGLSPDQVSERRVGSVEQAYAMTFSESWLLASIHARHISANTATHVIQHARKRCDPTFMERLMTLQKQHWPIVLLSLRFDNRSWVDQIEGFTQIAASLRQDFPEVAFVIHGLSKGVAMGWSTWWMSLEVEIKAAAELEQALGGPQHVANAVGLGIHESVVIADLCDLYLAPVGSGMALYKWLTNKPGVAFSNRFCLDPTNPGRWAFTVFDQHRQDIIPANYIPLTAVTDVEADCHGEPSRANFTLDRSVLYATLRDFIGTLPRRNG